MSINNKRNFTILPIAIISVLLLIYFGLAGFIAGGLLKIGFDYTVVERGFATWMPLQYYCIERRNVIGRLYIWQAELLN